MNGLPEPIGGGSRRRTRLLLSSVAEMLVVTVSAVGLVSGQGLPAVGWALVIAATGAAHALYVLGLLWCGGCRRVAPDALTKARCSNCGRDLF